MKRLVLAATLVALPLSAFAGGDRNYLQPDQHWFGPISYQFDSTNDDSIGVDANDSLTERNVVKAAFQTWEDVACTDIDFVDATNYNFSGNPTADLTWGSDGISAVVFEENDYCSGGTIAFNIRNFNSNTETLNGHNWREIHETDTSFCQQFSFGTPAEIDSPACSGLMDMQGVALHEGGHGIGYAHTCEAEDSCGDPELRTAVMYWAVGTCDGSQRFPNPYDLETHSISYGLGASSDLMVTNGAGGLPLEVTFTPVVIASASITSVVWDFGDQTSETTSGAATHTYVSEGRFSVGATIHANAPACGGDFTEQVRKVEAVIACNDLEPEFRFERDGKKVKFFSETLGAAAGCLQTLNWDFGDGSTANVKNPIHEYSSTGTYTVSLSASGPPGTSAPFTREVKVSSGGGGGLFGCSLDAAEGPSANSAAAAGVLCIAVAMSLATVGRRRRVD